MLRPGLILSVLLIISMSASAQRRVSADMEVKTLYGGKVTSVESKVYCSSTGDLVRVFNSPSTYYTITNQ